jgi:hypothetical protein
MELLIKPNWRESVVSIYRGVSMTSKDDDLMSMRFDQRYLELVDRISERYLEGCTQAVRSDLLYPIGATLSHQLNWSHYCELAKIEDADERAFYYNQSINENWSIRELQRQKQTGLYLQLALGKDDAENIKLPSEKEQTVAHPKDIVKETYFFEHIALFAEDK